MEKFKDIVNSKIFIKTIRLIGLFYLITIIINTICCYGEFMYKTFFESGLYGVIAFAMTEYKGIEKKE